MMGFKDRFTVSLKAAYTAAFHKETPLGKMGYLYDELEIVGNDINYLKYTNNDIYVCNVQDEECKKGIDYFAEGKYKKAFAIFNSINVTDCPEVNYCLAVCYLYGKGVKKNVQKGFQIAKEASVKSLCCLQLMARCYIEGRGLPQENKKKAYESLLSMINDDYKGINDVNEDYLFPELFYFCGEYEMEKGMLDLAVKHLSIAAIDGNYGMAYYALGKLYYDEEPEKARIYLDKAKALKVNVAAKYYSREREGISDEAIDMGMSDMTAKGAETLQNLKTMKDIGQEFDIQRLKADHIKAKNEKCLAEGELADTKRKKDSEEQMAKDAAKANYEKAKAAAAMAEKERIKQERELEKVKNGKGILSHIKSLI